VVSHDREFLDRHANRIAALDAGRLELYAGNYSAYEEQKLRHDDERAARLRALDRQIAHAGAFVERFGAQASRARQAQSRKKQIERLGSERAALAPRRERRALRFEFPAAVRSGDIVLRLERVGFGYAAQPVYQELDLEIRRAERVALVGPNGAGKSTLLRLAAGALTPQSGTCELGHNVRLAYFAQHQVDALDASRTVYEEIEADAPLDWVPRLRTLLGTFLFSGDDIEKKVAVLSGGERARLALAKLLLCGANFLVLDEPTNHMDIQAREVLGQALARFPGTLLFISHDRRFIDALANRIVAITPGARGAQLESHRGNYGDYARRAQAGAAAPGPTPAPRSAPVPADCDRETEPTGSEAAPGGPPPRSRRLSSNARRRLEQESRETEQAIVELEEQLQQLDGLFADPAVARDGARVRRLRQQRDLLEAELRERYEQWQDLEERLAGGS
jgi:ATP-binding cassette subfamily F protein 3